MEKPSKLTNLDLWQLTLTGFYDTSASYLERLCGNHCCCAMTGKTDLLLLKFPRKQNRSCTHLSTLFFGLMRLRSMKRIVPLKTSIELGVESMALRLKNMMNDQSPIIPHPLTLESLKETCKVQVSIFSKFNCLF